MIVVATNNGFDYLERCLKSIRMYTKGVRILVADTGSSEEFIKLGQSIAESYGAEWTQSKHGHYDFGAYIHAYKNYPSEWYWFQHDSVCFKSYVAYDLIRKQVEHGLACAWTNFVYWTCPYDNEEQMKWVNSVTGETSYKFGCFGPNFGISKSNLDLLDQTFDFSKIIVDTKLKQQGMERAWPIMFDKAGIYFTWLENTAPSTFWQDFHEDKMIYFWKQRHREGPRQ